MVESWPRYLWTGPQTRLEGLGFPSQLCPYQLCDLAQVAQPL